MKRLCLVPQWLAAALVVGAVLAAAGRCQAGEQAQVFLDRLRERGLYDIALEYLDQMRTSKLAPKEFQEKIDYEAAICLQQQSETTRSLKTREEQLNAARDRFTKFVNEHPKHESAADANTQLAAVEMSRGKIRMLEAEKAETDKEKQAKRQEARKLFESARKVFVEAEKLRRAKVKEFPVGPIDPKKVKLIEERDQAREQWTRSLFLMAYASYYLAHTYEPGSKEFKEQMTKAAEEYASIHQQFMNTVFVAAPQARLLEGKCYVEMGDTKKAFEILEELEMLQDDPPAFREVKNSAVALHMEGLMRPGKEDFAAAYKVGTSWLATAGGKDESSDAGLTIRFLTGKAALELARKATKSKDSRKQQREYLDLAEDAFKFVSRMPGEHQKEARELLLDRLLEGDRPRPVVKTFNEARDYGNDAWQRMLAVMESLKAEDLEEADKKRLQDELAESRQKARDYYRAATRKWTPDIPIGELNLLRYRLSYMFWDSSEYYPAAVLGEFLARHYPSSDFALQGAQIALGSFYSMIKQTPNADHSFEIDRMVRVAEYIAKTWPNKPEATQAIMLLIETAVKSGNLKDAVNSLQAVPADAPSRADAELFVGFKLWMSVCAERRKPDDQQMPAQALNALQADAKRILLAGVTRERAKVAQGKKASDTLALGVLALVQVLVRDFTDAQGAEADVRKAIDAEQAKLNPEEGEKPDAQTAKQIQAKVQQLKTQLQEAEKRTEEAVFAAAQWLDDPQVGALKLIELGQQTAASEAFQSDAYRSALLVYADLLGRTGSKITTKELTEVMGRLEALMDKDADQAKLLTRTYLSVAVRAASRIRALEDAGNNDAVKKVREGFELLLERFLGRKTGLDFRSLNWAAGMLYRMAEEFGANRVKAKAYYEKAAAGYERILELAQNDPNSVPQKLLVSIRLRLAKCYTGAGQFQKAIKLLDGILKDQQGMLPVQVDAAMAFQQWGPGNPDAYMKAIFGDKQYPNIWGWSKIVRALNNRPEKLDAQGNPITNYAETFHKARYNSILCRTEFAQKQTGAARTDHLQKAKQNIRDVYKWIPDMGGKEMKPRYEELLKRIQSLQGESPEGLKAFEKDQ